jgi:hypothetical protein
MEQRFGQALTSGLVDRAAAFFVEPVGFRVGYAALEGREMRRLSDDSATVVGDAAPHPLPWRFAFLNPASSEFPAHRVRVHSDFIYGTTENDPVYP